VHLVARSRGRPDEIGGRTEMLSWMKRAFGVEQQLFVDHKRINPEIQAERRRELEGSFDRRRKIMDRMTLGYACPHPSWIQEHGLSRHEERKARLLTA
jgi:hypothetical protein